MLGRIEEAEDFPLLGMVGAGGITGGKSVSAVFLTNKLLFRQVLRTDESPEIAGLLIQPFRSGLGEAVSQRLHKKGGVVVVVVFKGLGVLAELGPRRDGEAADCVDASQLAGRDEIGQGVIRQTLKRLVMLAEHVKLSNHEEAIGIVIELDIIPHPSGRPEAADSADQEFLLLHDCLKNLERIACEARWHWLRSRNHSSDWGSVRSFLRRRRRETYRNTLQVRQALVVSQ